MSHPALALNYGKTQGNSSQGLYASVIGHRFRYLHDSLRKLHGDVNEVMGICGVRRGNGLARIVATLLSLPRAGKRQALRVVFERHRREGVAYEKWQRYFSGRGFTTRQWEKDGLLYERFGLMQFGFRLHADKTGLRHELADARLLGFRLPRLVWPVILGEEWPVGRNGVGFRVSVALPLLGPLIQYGGLAYVGNTDAATVALSAGERGEGSCEG